MDVVRDVDYILDTYVGGGHWWQWKITLVILTLVEPKYSC
jgi:hypothetical protein